MIICACLTGVVTAGIAFPFVAIAGLTAKAGVDTLEALPAELITRRAPQASEVYAADNTTLISRFFDDNRRDVALDAIAEPMRQAIVAAEDHSFHKHDGVDLRGMVRSFVNNRNSQAKQGGSTLTMQYVRMSITNSSNDPTEIVAGNEDTTARKVREVRMARQLERQTSKAQIMEGYLNMAPFGNGTYGVHTASKLYFGKAPKDLTIAEAATLAAIVKSPAHYDPLTPDGATRTRERRDWVIEQMVEIKAISPEQATAAKATPLTVTGQRQPGGCTAVQPNHWGFFCDYFYRWWLAQPAFGDSTYDRERRLKSGGYRIVTTLDPAVQNAAHTNVQQHLATGNRNALNIAAVEPGSGRVRALATNRTFALDDPARPNPRSSNPKEAARGARASYPNTTNPLLTDGGYQAGSTFKIFTLVAALEQGIPLNTPVDAKPVYRSKYRGASGASACDGGGDQWCPSNNNPGMAGRHDAWSAFGRSVNTYFVPLEERVGAGNVVAAARKLGIGFPSEEDRKRADNPRTADGWGAFTLGVSATTPLDLANAYATLAADGRHCHPTPVQEIRDPDGHPLPVAEPRCDQAVKPDVARAAIDAARCPVGDRSQYGECAGATEGDARRVVGHPVAGKTGTTDSHRTASLAITTRSLAVAGILADPDWPETTTNMSHDIVNPAVYETLADAMRGRPKQDFPKTSRRLALGG